MTDAAALVTALKAKLRTWQAVADACNTQGHEFDPSYYWRIADGRIKMPGARGRRGIAAAAESVLRVDITGLNGAREREPRYGLTVRHSMGLATNQWRIAHRLGWDEWMERAQELMAAEYGS